METNHIKGTNWTNEEAKALGLRIKSLRVLNELTQEELAAKADLAVRTVAAIEQGRYNTGVRQLTAILDAMGYDLDFKRRCPR